MPSYAVVGATRGMGVSRLHILARSTTSSQRATARIRPSAGEHTELSGGGVTYSHACTKSRDANNQVFAIYRNPQTAAELFALEKASSNVHTVRGDLEDFASLKVRGNFSYPLDVV